MLSVSYVPCSLLPSRFTPAAGEQGAVDTRLATSLRDLFKQIKNSGARARASARPATAQAPPRSPAPPPSQPPFPPPPPAGDIVVPQQFHTTLQQAFPTFQQRTREGHLMQQDAEECWSSIVSTLARKLRAPSAADAAPSAAAAPGDSSAVRQMFGIDFVTKLKCDETGACAPTPFPHAAPSQTGPEQTPPTAHPLPPGEERTVEETQYLFKCNITAAVSHLNDGFRLSCDMTRQQRSELAGRDVDFVGVSRIARLPPLLTVQLVRFFWKADVSMKAKILKAVTFPVLLARGAGCAAAPLARPAALHCLARSPAGRAAPAHLTPAAPASLPTGRV